LGYNLTLNLRPKEKKKRNRVRVNPPSEAVRVTGNV